MKSLFEWKKDIDDKVAKKRELIVKRNARLRSVSGISLAVMLCMVCSVAVVRFSKIDQPPVDTSSDGIMTIPNFSDYTFPGETEPSATDGGVMTIPSFPHFTGAADTGSSAGNKTGEVTDYPASHPIFTGEDPYPVTTGGDAFVTTTASVFRGHVEEIIRQAFPEKTVFPNATEYKKTFATALEYYGLSDMNVAPSLRAGVVYRIDFKDSYTFLADDNGGAFGVIVRDDITVNYVSDVSEVYYQLSMGRVTVPYDWVFTTASNNTFDYKGIEVKTGYINGNGTSAELMVADYEYNGIKFRFTGHNVFEKEFLSCLYNVIDCLFRK